MLLLLKLGYRQLQLLACSSEAIGLSRSPLSSVAAVNWQPLRFLSPLTRTKHSGQIQRSTDNEWDFPASRLFVGIAQQNHLLEIIPVYDKRQILQGETNIKQAGRQAEGGDSISRTSEDTVEDKRQTRLGSVPRLARADSRSSAPIYSHYLPVYLSQPSPGLPSPDAGPQCARCCVSPPPSESET